MPGQPCVQEPHPAPVNGERPKHESLSPTAHHVPAAGRDWETADLRACLMEPFLSA